MYFFILCKEYKLVPTYGNLPRLGTNVFKIKIKLF